MIELACSTTTSRSVVHPRRRAQKLRSAVSLLASMATLVPGELVADVVGHASPQSSFWDVALEGVERLLGGRTSRPSSKRSARSTLAPHQAALVLCGDGDLVQVALGLNRCVLGNERTPRRSEHQFGRRP